MPATTNCNGLPLIIDFLRVMHQDTGDQVELLERARRISGSISDIDAAQMTT